MRYWPTLRNEPMRALRRPTTLCALTLLVSGAVVAVHAGTALADAATCSGHAVTIAGTDGDDTIDLTGNPGQVVAALGGNDEVLGSDGADVVCLGDGNDRFGGRGGDDEAEGGPGGDVLKGGPGRDHLNGGSGDDRVQGGGGNDQLNGGDATTSNAESGDDEIFGKAGYDRLWSNWSSADHDADGSLRGGRGYDYCVNGASQRGCERDHTYAVSTGDPTANEWYPLIDEVFARWGLDQESCATHPDANGVDVEFCIPDQRANAVEILMCESGGWPFAQNGTSGTAGLFQHHPLYWQGRVDHLLEFYSAIESDFPADADSFDPEWNTVITAMLVYEARETILLRDPAPGYPYTMVAGPYYPTFNYQLYADHYYDNYDPDVGGPTHITRGGYSNGGEGPQPWGPWVSCAAPTSVWPAGQDLYDPGWVNPWDGTVPGHENPAPDWWPVPPLP